MSFPDFKIVDKFYEVIYVRNKNILLNLKRSFYYSTKFFLWVFKAIKKKFSFY